MTEKEYDIQLFAAGDSAQNIPGDTASDAGGQNAGEKGAPDAGEQTAAQRGERFKELIQGEFKAEYNESVQRIVKQRLKHSEEAAKSYEALTPVLRLLERRYDTRPGDIAALTRALEDDAEAGRRGEAGEARARENASRLYGEWMRQAAELREAYPDFNLSVQLRDGQFKELLRGGASIRAAYELANRESILRASAEEMERRITRRILSGLDRPKEGGLSSQGAAVVKSDAASMSRDARREIIRRVQRGERISL